MAKDDAKNKDGKGEEKKEEKKEAPKKPTPQFIEVDYVGKDGKYSFDVNTFDENRRGIKANVRITEGTVSRSTKQTDDNGFLEFVAREFDEKERDFIFRILGVEAEQHLTLDGPKQEKKPKELLEGKGFEGFKANFFNAINRNKKK